MSLITMAQELTGRVLKTGELPLESEGGLFIRIASIFKIRKITEMFLRVVMPDAHLPFSCVLIPRNPLASSGVVFLYTSVCLLLAAIGDSQIAAPIIEAIMIAMVSRAFISRIETEYFAMHSNLGSSSRRWISNGIPSFASFFLNCSPFPLIEPFKIFFINNGKQSMIERDKTIRWLRRGHAHVTSWVGLSAAATADPLIVAYGRLLCLS